MGGDTLRVHISDIRQTIHGRKKKREKRVWNLEIWLINRYKAL